MIMESGIVECILEPRGEHGLEGYDLGGHYTYQKCKDNVGIYYRVFPNIDSDYYETTTVFKKYFSIIDSSEIKDKIGFTINCSCGFIGNSDQLIFTIDCFKNGLMHGSIQCPRCRNIEEIIETRTSFKR